MNKVNQHPKTIIRDKHAVYRILAVICAALCVGVLFIPLKTLVGGFVIESKSLVDIVGALASTEYKILGFLPSLTSANSVLGYAATAGVYVFLCAVLVAFVLSILAIIRSKNAPMLVHWAIFTFTWGAAAFALSVLVITSYVTTVKITIDASAIAITVIGAVLYFAAMAADLGKLSIVNAVRFLLALAFTGCLLLGLTLDGTLVSKMVNGDKAWKVWIVLIVALLGANLVLSSVRAMMKKGLFIDFVSAIIEGGLAIGVVCISYAAKVHNESYVLLAMLGMTIALLQTLLSGLHISYDHKETLFWEKAAVRNEMLAKAEAESAQSVGAPAEEAPAAYVNEEATAYLSDKPEDAFLATLSDKEKGEFTDLYLLKKQGAMPEMPEYVMGGDNKDFFEKVFIYLGQYRDKIPDALLSKMYDFSMAN